MNKCFMLGALLLAGQYAGVANAGTVDDIKALGKVNCGVSMGLVGFSSSDSNGNWNGFDVDFCRAVAGAVLGDPTAVEFIPTTAQSRFTKLAAGEVDLLARNTAWTFSRDVDLKLTFVGINYYGGQGFLVPKDLGILSAKDLNDYRVCIQMGTSYEVNLADFFSANNVNYEPVPVDTSADAQEKYLAKECDAYTMNASGLAATRAMFQAPDDHILLPEIISKEPLGPVVRHGDDDWADIVRWTLYALITAEEYDVTSANVEEMSMEAGSNPEVNRLLGTDGSLGEMLGLDPGWAKAAIAAGGNYGELFEKNIGEKTPIGLARGLNALWTNGGLIYAPPFR